MVNHGMARSFSSFLEEFNEVENVVVKKERETKRNRTNKIG
jgi:hypothetical protein